VTPEQAKELIAAEDHKLQALEAAIARLASASPTPVLLAMLRALVEMVCAAQGQVFVVHNKIMFYKAVIEMLNRKGIS
jgi:hypothetical protein